MLRPRFELWQGDAVTFLRRFADGSVDLIITDPPYESLEEHRAIGTTTRLKHSKASSNDWFAIFPNSRFDELFAELYRVLRRNAHCYMYCDAKTMFVAKPAGERAGFKFWKPIIWDKVAIGMGYHYRARYECVLFFEKGKRKLNDLGIADIITAKRIVRGYPTQKPTEVSDVLVAQSSEPGELVIDPFMGSGSAGVSALRAARYFAGNDLCAEAVEVTRARLVAIDAIEVAGDPAQRDAGDAKDDAADVEPGDAGVADLAPYDVEHHDAGDQRLIARIQDLPEVEPPPGWEDRAVQRFRDEQQRRELAATTDEPVAGDPPAAAAATSPIGAAAQLGLFGGRA